MRRTLLRLSTTIVLATTACGGEPAPSVDDQPGAVSFDDGTTWELTAGTVDGRAIPVPDGLRATFTVDDGQVGGTAVCNGYGGEIAVDGHQISIGMLGGTDMACAPAEAMEGERLFLDSLARVETAERTGDRLVLEGPDVRLEFAAQEPVPTEALVGTTWMLDTLIRGDTASSVGGGPATLVLHDDGTLEGGTGCRSLTGRYAVHGDTVQFTEFAAHGECPAQLRDQDDHVVTVLGDGFRAAVDGQRLTLTSAGDLGLAYTAR